MKLPNILFCLFHPLPVSPFVGHRLSPRIDIVFSHHPVYLNFSMSHSSIFLISNTSRSSLYTFIFSHYEIPDLFRLPQGHICASSSSRLLVLLSGRPRSPTRNCSSSVFARSIGPCKYVFIYLLSNLPYVSKSSFPFHLLSSR